MRAAHSLKGAARMVGLDVGVRVAHAIEDCFVAAQEGRLKLRQESHRPAARGDRPARAHRPHRRGEHRAVGRREEGGSRDAPRGTRGHPGRRRRHADRGTRPGRGESAGRGRPRSGSERTARAARVRPRAAGLRGKPQPSVEPRRRVARGVAMGQAVRRVAPAAQAAAARSDENPRDRRRYRLRAGACRSGPDRARRCAAPRDRERRGAGAAPRRAGDLRPPVQRSRAPALRGGARRSHAALRRRRRGTAAHGRAIWRARSTVR